MIKIKYIVLLASILLFANIHSQNIACSDALQYDISTIGVYSSGDWSKVDRVSLGSPLADISASNPYINPNDLYFNNGRTYINLTYIKRHWLWGDSDIGTALVEIKNVNPSAYVPGGFNIVCSGESFEVQVHPSGGDLTYTIPTSSITQFIDTYTITPPANLTTGNYTFTYTVNSGGCTFATTEPIIVTEKPDLTWSNQFPSGNLVLDSDYSPVGLTANTTTANTTIEYTGAGINGTDFTPGNAGYGTHEISAIATTQYNCLDTITYSVEITHDPGILFPPQIQNTSSGTITAQDFNGNQVYPTNQTNTFGQEYSEMHVCDGQTINISTNNYSSVGIDSIIYIYNNNGVYDTIGIYEASNSTITYEIPKTNSGRLDFILSRYKSNLGVWGATGNTPVYVTSINPGLPTSTLVCGDEFSFFLAEEGQGDYLYIWDRPYADGTVNDGNDYIFNPATYTTTLKDFSNNNLTFPQQFGYGKYPLSATKSQQITRTITTTAPYNDIGFQTVYNSIVNGQICSFTDTITIVRPPVANYNYSGDTLILGGTTVQVENTSTLEDWVTFDFQNGKGEQMGDTIVDTLFVNNGSLIVTAYDNFGCQSDSINPFFVSITDNPGIGLLDSMTSGVLYPVRNAEFTFSGDTDNKSSELHLCDGQSIDLLLDTSRLDFDNGIDSIYYFYSSNGIIDTIGKYSINQIVSTTIPKTNQKRVDTIYTQLITVTGAKGEVVQAPIFISIPIQREPSSQILNCNKTISINQTEYIGQTGTDFIGLQHFVLNGIPADASTFNTTFKDVNGNLLPSIGNFSRTLSTGAKVDTVFRTETTYLPYRGNNFTYYNKIANPQTCQYNDSIIIVRPPVASFTYSSAFNIPFGTSIDFTNNSDFENSIDWYFHDGTGIYTGNTQNHYLYNIGLHDITLTAYDIYGCQDDTTATGYVNVMDWTGIDEENSISKIQSFPNPMQDNLTIKITSSKTENASIFILDMSGRLVLEKDVNLSASENTINIDVSTLSKGTYTFKIIGKNINLSQKIVK